jgi:hypothetical protein
VTDERLLFLGGGRKQEGGEKKAVGGPGGGVCVDGTGKEVGSSTRKVFLSSQCCG